MYSIMYNLAGGNHREFSKECKEHVKPVIYTEMRVKEQSTQVGRR